MRTVVLLAIVVLMLGVMPSSAVSEDEEGFLLKSSAPLPVGGIPGTGSSSGDETVMCLGEKPKHCSQANCGPRSVTGVKTMLDGLPVNVPIAGSAYVRDHVITYGYEAFPSQEFPAALKDGGQVNLNTHTGTNTRLFLIPEIGVLPGGFFDVNLQPLIHGCTPLLTAAGEYNCRKSVVSLLPGEDARCNLGGIACAQEGHECKLLQVSGKCATRTVKRSGGLECRTCDCDVTR